MEDNNKKKMAIKYFGKGTPDWIIDKCVLMLKEQERITALNIPCVTKRSEQFSFDEIYKLANSLNKGYFLEMVGGIKS